MKKKLFILIIMIGILLLILASNSYATEYRDLNNYVKIEIPSKYDVIFNNYLYSSNTAIGSEMAFECSEEDVHITMYTVKKDIGADKILKKTVMNGSTYGDLYDAWENDEDVLNFIKEYIDLKRSNATTFDIYYGNTDYGNPLQRAIWTIDDTDWLIDNFAIESDDYVTWILIRFKCNPDSMFTFGDCFFDTEEELGIIDSFQYITNNTNYVCNLSFADVYNKNWYCEAVRYAYKRGIIAGYDEYTFAPRANLTREQLVAFLWRIEGEPDASTLANDFSDVPNGQWYTNPIKWAKANGIVNGYEGTTKFGRGDKIIRQDLAKILYNFAEYKGINTDEIASFENFKDHDYVSYYAIRSVRWAIKNGIISGNSLPDGTRTIAPHDNATRAEAAVMIYKFCENVLK